MPGMYAEGDYDLAGFAVGVVERDARAAAAATSRRATSCSAWPRRGVHSNGYSLVRRVVERPGLGCDAPAPFDPADRWARRC